MGMLRSLGEADLISPPKALLLQSADVEWLASGVETLVQARGSSVLQAAGLAVGGALKAQLPLLADRDMRSILPRQGALVVQRHEGSYYPWRTVRRFVELMCSSGNLSRFDTKPAVMVESGHTNLLLTPADTYLPTYAAAQLNLSLRAVASVAKLRESLVNGPVVGFGALHQVWNGTTRVWRTAAGAAAGESLFARKVYGCVAHSC